MIEIQSPGNGFEEQYEMTSNNISLICGSGFNLKSYFANQKTESELYWERQAEIKRGIFGE